MKHGSLRWALLLTVSVFAGCGGPQGGMPADVAKETPKPSGELQSKMIEHQKLMRSKGSRR